MVTLHASFNLDRSIIFLRFLLLKPKPKPIPRMAPTIVRTPDYDRTEEVKDFDETKAGVKGLTDSGIKKIPRIFVHSPENLPKPSDLHDANLRIPVIDLQGADDPNNRQRIVAEVCRASESWGFFQLLNHGVPIEVADGVMQGNRRFHELDVEVKAKFYTRDMKKKVKYACNFDLYSSPAANWRDTIYCRMDESLDPAELPSVCREEMLSYKQQVLVVAETLCELFSEALSLDKHHLRSINSIKSSALVAHYYPPCPEPDLTLGTTRHADPSFFTLLLQDDLGGLQVLHRNQWVPVAPIRGALVVNVGDFLQLMSNGKFKSAEHRVLASYGGPRLSVAAFFHPSNDEERLYGPIKEVLSDEEPPLYKEILVRDYMMSYVAKGLGEESALNHFRQ